MARTSDPAGQSLAEIADYHNDAVDSLTFFLQHLWQQKDPRFLLYSSSEFNQLVRRRIEETDLRSCLATLAALEAALRIDYRLRVKQRRKDPLSKAFRVKYRTKREKIRFDEDLLEAWVEHYPDFKRVIGELRGALHFRHWLAHGRSWERPTHGRFDYINIYQLAKLMFSNLPLVSQPS